MTERITQQDVDMLFPEYRDLLAASHIDGIKLAHAFNSRDGTPMGGATIAYRKVKNNKSGLFQISSAICNKTDVFLRKYGAAQALQNFYDGKTILINIGAQNVEHAGSFFKNTFNNTQYEHLHI